MSSPTLFSPASRHAMGLWLSPPAFYGEQTAHPACTFYEVQRWNRLMPPRPRPIVIDMRADGEDFQHDTAKGFERETLIMHKRGLEAPVDSKVIACKTGISSCLAFHRMKVVYLHSFAKSRTYLSMERRITCPSIQLS